MKKNKLIVELEGAISFLIPCLTTAGAGLVVDHMTYLKATALLFAALVAGLSGLKSFLSSTFSNYSVQSPAEAPNPSKGASVAPIAAIMLLCAFLAPTAVYAQTNTLPSITADTSLLKSWGIDGEVTAFTYATYAPSLKHSLGGGIGGLYHSATNSILGTEARLQYLNIAKQEGQIWQPNLMETASKRLTVGKYFVEPVVELGVAMDSRCHPYMITGGALAVGRGNFSAFTGVERWVGPYDSFTCYQAGVAWHF